MLAPVRPVKMLVMARTRSMCTWVLPAVTRMFIRIATKNRKRQREPRPSVFHFMGEGGHCFLAFCVFLCFSWLFPSALRGGEFELFEVLLQRLLRIGEDLGQRRLQRARRWVA